jgi:hypothetical protein
MADCRGRLDAREGLGRSSSSNPRECAGGGAAPALGVHREGRDFNMHDRVAMLQAIHHGQPEPGRHTKSGRKPRYDSGKPADESERRGLYDRPIGASACRAA